MLPSKSRIAFVSTMAGAPWGGSEELWCQSALRLAKRGKLIAASVYKWPKTPQSVSCLLAAGVKVQQRPFEHGLLSRIRRKIVVPNMRSHVFEIMQFLKWVQPSLIVLSDGKPLPPIDVIELCIERKWKFVTIGHNGSDCWWPGDEIAARYRDALKVARMCYFVSENVRRLIEKQLGCVISNSDIVRNPFNVAYDVNLLWPMLRQSEEVCFACVGSLHPNWKGQDLLLEALAKPVWQSRAWRLTFFGEGPSKNVLERLVSNLGLGNRVLFAGHVSSIVNIWKANHVLVQPSRSEGLPISIVEAMLCGRPVVATDVAGHSEVIDDGVNGFLADAPTTKSLEEAIERLWINRFKLEQMGSAARDLIRKRVPADPVGVFLEKLVNCL